MATYEQKLNEFAQGKRLLRLARPIRDRADVFCDACGSTQPRTLYALEDLDSERHYFVGDTCLKELAKRGAILRYGHHSGRVAFDNEMKLRAQEFEVNKGTNADGGPHSNPGEQRPPVIIFQPKPGNDAKRLFPAILVIQTAEGYQAFAYAFSARDGTYSWGHAQETRHHEVWHLGGEKGLVLEQERVERPDAFARCINDAWEEACSGRRTMGLALPSQGGTNGSNEKSVSDHALNALLRFGAMVEIATSLPGATTVSRGRPDPVSFGALGSRQEVP